MQPRSLGAAFGTLALSTLMLIAAPLAAEAHETRTIADGTYQIVVGFRNEPVFAGDKSGLEFWVTEVSDATPAAGTQETDEAAGATMECCRDRESCSEASLPTAPKMICSSAQH